MFKSEFLQTLSSRGFIHQCTDFEGLDNLMCSPPISGYIGFDATAPSLHAGSLIQIMMLAHLQRCGHRPIIVLGGGTTKIGDPSGKDAARQILTEETIQQNMLSIKKIFTSFISFDSSSCGALFLDNAQWLDHLGYMDFLRNYGRFFSVNRMLNFDSVKLRLEREQPLSFLEFNYMILQAYDFAYLAEHYGCRLQMGGSDQWGNIVNGIDLAKRLDLPLVYGLSSPLLQTACGAKMGKTAQGAVWLNPEHMSAFDYWQFWRNVQDEDVIRFLKLYTFLPLEEIDKLSKLQGAELNDAKKILADHATSIIHGHESLEAIHLDSHKFFKKEGLSSVSSAQTIVLHRQDFPTDGFPIIGLLQKLSLVSSNSEGRRLIRAGAVRMDEAVISDELFKITPAVLRKDKIVVISTGKKKFKGVKLGGEF